MRRSALLLTLLLAAAACRPADEHVLTFAGSSVGREGEVLRAQLARFQAQHPDPRVELRPTPDAADNRHQLYVQWLNAHAGDPDVLQLDIVWTPEFAAAGWILDLARFTPPLDDFFAPAVAANRWRNRLFALPWFIDAGMLYWRTDLVDRAPETLADLSRDAARVRRERGVPFGFVWQGARYEGLITTFVEILGAFGGRITDEHGRVVVDSPQAIDALTYLRDAIGADGIVPPSVLTWQEEQVRFAFQNGQAVFMRNWPYAYERLEDAAESSVADHVGIAPMPGGPGGMPTAALGGAQLAINAYSGDADAAYRLIAFLLEPAQLLERARVTGQYPPRPTMYAEQGLADALPVPLDDVRRIIERAVPRPVTPVYTELSEILQIALHRVLTRQQEPAPALRAAATSMRALLDRVELGEGG